MKRYPLILSLIIMSAVMVACGMKSLNQDEFVGTWRARDGGELVLNIDGAFVARGLPSGVFFSPEKKGSLINGAGNWTLQKRQDQWEIKLSFRSFDGKPASYGVPLNVMNSEEIFRWEDDEGGARYELRKQKN